MQGGRSASVVESAKEEAANVGASAWAGKEKAKAVVQEKAAKVRAHDPAEKAAADARMEDRVREVEAVKQGAIRRNAATKERASATDHHPTPLGVGGATAAPPAVTAGPDVCVLDSPAAPTTVDDRCTAGVPPVGAETGAAAARPAGTVPDARFARTEGVAPASSTAGGRNNTITIFHLARMIHPWQ